MGMNANEINNRIYDKLYALYQKVFDIRKLINSVFHNKSQNACKII